MKRLLLLRHAKASQDKLGIRDQDRELTERGRDDAVRLGRFLHDEEYFPDLVLCSTSVRTSQTLELLLPELGARLAVQYLPELYLAAEEAIFEVARRTRETVGSLMIVAHNPGLEMCAQDLVRVPAERKARKRYLAMTGKFPTAALAVIAFETAHWGTIEPGTGELELFVRPKDLREEEG